MIRITSMAAKNTENEFDYSFDESGGVKAQNDPWAALVDKNTIPKIPNAPNDPLHERISSEKYLESLEKKLMRLKGRKDKETKASEMIFSLQKTKEDQLNQILAGQNQLCDFDDEIDCQENTVVSALQRKLNPDRQALNPVELYPLLNNDFLAKSSEASEDSKTDSEITKVNLEKGL